MNNVSESTQVSPKQALKDIEAVATVPPAKATVTRMGRDGAF